MITAEDLLVVTFIVVCLVATWLVCRFLDSEYRTRMAVRRVTDVYLEDCRRARMNGDES